MFTISYVLLKDKRQWLHRQLRRNLRLLQLLRPKRQQLHHLLLFQQLLPPLPPQVLQLLQHQEEEALVQPQYPSPAPEQATAKQKVQLMPSSKKKERWLAPIKVSRYGDQLTPQDS